MIAIPLLIRITPKVSAGRWNRTRFDKRGAQFKKNGKDFVARRLCPRGALLARQLIAKKNKLTQVAVRIGVVVGKGDRKVQKVAKAGKLAKKELDDLSKQVDFLKRQLQKTVRRLKRALS